MNEQNIPSASEHRILSGTDFTIRVAVENEYGEDMDLNEVDNINFQMSEYPGSDGLVEKDVDDGINVSSDDIHIAEIEIDGSDTSDLSILTSDEFWYRVNVISNIGEQSTVAYGWIEIYDD